MIRLSLAELRSATSCFETVLAFTADVAPHHRFVPEECVFGCQGALLSLCCNNSVVTSHILEEKKQFAVDLTGLLSGPDRAILWMEKYYR